MNSSKGIRNRRGAVEENEEKKQEDHHQPLLLSSNSPKDNDPATSATASTTSASTTKQQDSVQTSKKTAAGTVVLAKLVLRLLLLDLPLLLLFIALVSLRSLERFGHDYFVPQIDRLRWNRDRDPTEHTYYHRICHASDQTTLDTTDLLVTPDLTAPQAVDVMVKHGAALFPNLLSTETATELRDFVLAQNAKNQDMIYVISNQNRWSFFLRVHQHPIVAQALQEVLNQPLLVEALEGIAGRNPAVIEFTTITSAFGAKEQFWHQDVVPEGSAAKYARNFIPSYSLFIPLQNTTAGMGATGICPGTHMCGEGCATFCPQTGLRMSGKADNWPTGWGALVNQQTTHIGHAYTDPLGPHRVLFIISFAPRPRFGPFQLESRTIGTSGSYSLHWSQWGHTLEDFQNPARNMRQPWRTLRSLGLYKPANADWGWDFMTQASGRIAIGDTGYNIGDLEEMAKNLHGKVPDEEEDAASAWISFAFDTTARCRAMIEPAYLALLALYIVGSIIYACFVGGKKGVTLVVVTLFRSFLLRSVVLFIAWWGLSRAENRSWARNIRAWQQNSLSTFSSPHATLPDIPASLPDLPDILMLQEMKSDYFATFNRVLDVVHPGNKAWNEMVENSAVGYHSLSRNLQKALCSSLLQTIGQEQRRIMTKNMYGSWAEVDPSTAHWFCHKELDSKSNSYIREAIKIMDYFLTETRFGYWRYTALHRNHIPKLLMNFQDEILHHSRRQTLKPTESTTKTPLRKITSLLSFPKTTTSPRNKPGNRSILPPRLPPGEWFKEGDTVEATYEGKFEEWYRAYIGYANADTYTWDVEYEDGEEASGLCFHCIRPFVPYRLKERVEVRTGPESFSPGKVVFADSHNESFNVQLDSGQIKVNIPVRDMRRITKRPLARGLAVAALFDGVPDEWYQGVIVEDNSDGTYAIKYDDGDFSPRVRREDIRLL